MAAKLFTCQLFESKGLNKAIYFSGLTYNLIIHPYVYGEPLASIQPIYYLDELEAIARLRIEPPSPISEKEIEYLIDNYLFEYSLLNINSRMCSKITKPAFWPFDSNDLYQYHDNKNTRALTLDPLNDDSIVSLQDSSGKEWDFTDFCFAKPLIFNHLSNCAINIKKLYNEKINVMITPDSHRDGYMGKLRLIESENEVLDYTQALGLENKISFHRIINVDTFEIESEIISGDVIDIPVKKITTNKTYSPLLLSYYFSGLRERNPLLSFTGYYNVLEYYLEDAAPIMGLTTDRTEKENLRHVINLITNQNEIYQFIINSSRRLVTKIGQDIISSSGVRIAGVNVQDEPTLMTNISDWLYKIRCAVVHSKKSRRGQTEAIFEPYSSEADNIQSALIVIKWLSQKCILKDNELTNALP
ncbi:hypothetical protein [Erwinia sp. Leaf53]|uniref:hypothetical protein n=1 Tax=Erwinia sp. Leaf53 TaxID=1736225 RepID=UPI00092FB8F8|nr:hypothetical protein [Erwinia sp. Leaf53]